MIPTSLNVAAAISALIAAGFWWASALVPPPKYLGWGTTAPNNYKEVVAPGVIWATKTATRNKWGAAFAGITAVLTAISSLYSVLWSPI